MPEELSYFNELDISVEDVNGCFALIGGVILNSITLPANISERKTKINISKKWINETKLIQMWCDIAGYDEEVIKKRLLNKLT